MALAHIALLLVSGKVADVEDTKPAPVEEQEDDAPDYYYQCIRRLIVEEEESEPVLPDDAYSYTYPPDYQCIRDLEQEDDAPEYYYQCISDLGKCRALDLKFLETKLVEDGEFHKDDVHEAVEAYRDYFCLMASPEMENKGLAASEPIDKVWHAHILFTKKYFKHTREVAGRYIHHEPCGHSMTAEERKEGEEAYQNTFLAFKKVFGDKAPSKYWPGGPVAESVAQNDLLDSAEGGDDEYYYQCIRR